MARGSPNRQFGHDTVVTMLGSGKMFSALVCYNDLVATGVYAGLAERGIRPGQDLAIASFDNILEAAGLMPPLTTVQ